MSSQKKKTQLNKKVEQIEIYNVEYLSKFCLVGRVFANGPGDLGSIPGHVLPKTLNTVLDTSLLSTQ